MFQPSILTVLHPSHKQKMIKLCTFFIIRTTLSAVLDPEKQFGPKSNTVVQLPFDTSSIKNTETSEHTDLQDLAWCQGVTDKHLFQC